MSGQAVSYATEQRIVAACQGRGWRCKSVSRQRSEMGGLVWRIYVEPWDGPRSEGRQIQRRTLDGLDGAIEALPLKTLAVRP